MKPGGLGFARLATMVVFAFSCFGLLLFLWLSFGGAVPLKPKGYRFEVAFPEATTLAVQADVRVAGVSVGKVVSKRGAPGGNRTLATIEMKREFAPIRTDGRAKLRQKTLLGETYVELNPGSKRAPVLQDDSRLADVRVEEAVEFDEFLEVFPEDTRKAFRRWQANASQVIDGRDRDLNDALANIGPFAEDGSHLLEVLARRRGALKSLVSETGEVFEAFTEDEDALRAFLSDTATWFRATASERENLAESIRIFPTFLDESKATLRRLETFATDTRPLVRDLGPVARLLQPTLRDLRTTAPDLQTFFRSIPGLVDASADGLPALSRVLRGLEPVFEQTVPFLQQLNPLLQFLEVNNGKVSDFLSTGPAALAGRRSTNNPNGNGHVLPQLIMTGSQSILTPNRTSDNRGNTYLLQNQLTAPKSRYKDGFFVFPVWDCENAGGEKKAEEDNGPAPGGDPGCYVADPLVFKEKFERYPRVMENMPGE